MKLKDCLLSDDEIEAVNSPCEDHPDGTCFIDWEDYPSERDDGICTKCTIICTLRAQLQSPKLKAYIEEQVNEAKKAERGRVSKAYHDYYEHGKITATILEDIKEAGQEAEGMERKDVEVGRGKGKVVL